MATITQVARHAGVGVATVSRVLNGSPAVREQTRQRVLEAIAELGYAPNPAARALSTGRTLSVGVVAPFFTRPSVIERLRGISHILAGSGYRMVLFDVERPGQDSEFFRTLPGGLDGLLSISLCPPDADLDRFAAAEMPVVLVDYPHERLPAVHTDDVAGGRMATEHLLELGHERIAFLGDFEHNYHGFTSSAMRRVGYQEALCAAGLEVDMELVRRASHGREPATVLTRELLDVPDPPTAIFAASDTQAMGVLEAADELGIGVPDDLAVVGYDDIEIARYAGLTTIAQPLEESGAVGAHLLLAALGRAARFPDGSCRSGWWCAADAQSGGTDRSREAHMDGKRVRS